jgi:hypothetical protein
LKYLEIGTNTTFNFEIYFIKFNLEFWEILSSMASNTKSSIFFFTIYMYVLHAKLIFSPFGLIIIQFTPKYSTYLLHTKMIKSCKSSEEFDPHNIGIIGSYFTRVICTLNRRTILQKINFQVSKHCIRSKVMSEMSVHIATKWTTFNSYSHLNLKY